MKHHMCLSLRRLLEQSSAHRRKRREEQQQLKMEEEEAKKKKRLPRKLPVPPCTVCVGDQTSTVS